uniref:putative bifunctional diguanylate cyclase/phosphodiesterase n=1 Tax=uncultured Sphingomonas sp. TaxID=158754 RepID=UPI0035CA8A70
MSAAFAHLFGRRRSSWLIAGLGAIVGIVLMLGTTGDAIDRALSAARFGAVHRVASGQVVVVEMDAKSAAAIKRWPWSRSNYAAVVDHLRAAGAAAIVFDVDLSSASDTAGDAALAAALARSQGLVALPTFGQAASSAEERMIDAMPIPLFRSHVALASVSILPDRDGQVRSMPFGTITAGTPRPSLSAYIAQRSGTADIGFPIDMSIDPASIPRLSFIDVRNGTFDRERVRGRSVLIGATAIEMGDRYGTPLWGVVPGVIVQAMAAETLLRGVPVEGGETLPLLIGLVAVLVIVRMRGGTPIFFSVLAAGLLVGGAVLAAQHLLLITYPLASTLGMIATAGVACGVREIVGQFRTERTIDAATGLPNARPLLTRAGDGTTCTLVITQLATYDSLLAVLGPSLAADVVVRLAERLALVARDRQVYRTADRHLAFVLPHEESVEDTLDGLRAILLQPIEVAGRRVDVEVALGVAVGDQRGIERLLVDAALAAEEALRTGSFWQRSAIDDDVLALSLSLMGELDAALATGQIEVFYQPKYDLHQGRITSAEALVRWRHPERGFIGPDSFIPPAEKTNRIGPLTLYVLQRVVDDLADWRPHHVVTAAVNISAKLLSDAAFNAEVEQIVRESGVPPSALVFEVTESAAMSNPTSAIAALHRYRDLGIAVSMDDYGTGQSTLTYLKQLPLSELKIDRSFVQHAHLNRADSVLVRSTIQLAHELQLKVVAEGVEDRACLEFLRECGCDLIQGYFISRPLPLQDFRALLAERYSVAA